jgi:sugar lactone lactonase YvrE
MFKDVFHKHDGIELAGWLFTLALAVGCHGPLRSGGVRPDGAAGDAAASGTGGGGGGVGGTIAAADAGTTGELTLVAGKLGGLGDLDGVGEAARFRAPFGLAKDEAGHLFVSDSASHVIRQIDLQTGAVSTLAGSPGTSGSTDGSKTAARFNQPAGIAADGAGNLYVADSGNSTIRKIVVATGAVSTLAGSAGSAGGADGVEAAARFRRPMAVVSDGGRTLFVGDSFSIRKIVIATGAVTTVAGSVDTPGHKDGTGADARFTSPYGIVSDGSGRLFVADTFNQLIRAVDVATGAVTTLAGGFESSAPPGLGPELGPGREGNADGIGPDARFFEPTGITTDGAGNLYVADRFNQEIRKIVIASALVTTVGKANEPTGIVHGGAGELFVSNQFGMTIQKLVLATGEVSTLAGMPENFGNSDGPKDDVRFSSLGSIASDGRGNLFIADGGVLRKLVVASGTVTTFAGSADGAGYSADGLGTAARFGNLRGLAADGLGNLLATDLNAIRKIDLVTGAVTTLAGSPDEPGTSDGTGSAARFDGPDAVACDGAGSLFVADTGNYTIRKVDIASGTVTTLAGRARAGGSDDGIGTAALFFQSGGLACDDAGNLFVADTGNHAVRKIEVATGRVATLAGSATSAGKADGIGTSARFDDPVGIVFDGKGNLFVGDVNNHTIRKIVIATQTVGTVAGTSGRMGIVLGPLPAGLSTPAALAMAPSGDLLIGDASERAVLAVRF